MFVAALLAAVAGFVDAACFLGLEQVFTAHVTGNIASLASAFVAPGPTTALRVEVLVAFAAGAMIARVVSVSGERRSPLYVLRNLAACEATWLALAVITDVSAANAALHRWAIAGFAAAAMGCQSAASRLKTDIGQPTTVMTSNYTSWAIALVDTFMPRAGADSSAPHDAARDLYKLSLLLFAFASAAVAGAIAEQRYGFIALTIPLAVLVVWLVWLGRRASVSPPASRP